MKYFIKALNGCRMREKRLNDYAMCLDMVDREKDADFVLVWTCAFRKDREAASMAEIRRLLETTDKNVVVAGCLPSINPNLLKSLGPRVIAVPWKEDKCFLPLATRKAVWMQPANESRTGVQSYWDQWPKLLVSEGCNHKCTYCSERRAFPPYRSYDPDTIVRMINTCARKTVCLQADSIGQYGSDIGKSLLDILKAVDINHNVILTNMHPADWMAHREEYMRFTRSGLITHIQFPIQSANSRILQLMNREYDAVALHRLFREMVEQRVLHLFETHLICGFPTETEGEWNESFKFLMTYPVSYALLSAFYDVDNEELRGMGRVSKEEIKGRLDWGAERLRECGMVVNKEEVA